jgi:hypothetical protein
VPKRAIGQHIFVLYVVLNLQWRKLGQQMIAIAWSVIAPSIRAVAALVIIVGAAYGQNLPWCAIMDNDGTTQCNFSTLQQCEQTLSGIGGRCIENPAGSAPPSLFAPPSSENAQGLRSLQLQPPGPPPGFGGAMPPPPNN